VASFARLAGVTVGGSVTAKGVIEGFNLGPVAIGHDLVGLVRSDGPLAGVTVGGSVRGDLGAGSVTALGALGSVRIDGDVIGGSASGIDVRLNSGSILARRIARVTIGGSLIAGTDTTTGDFENNGAIRADDDLGPVLIKGNVFGNPTNPAIISAGRAMAGLTVLGAVDFAQVLAGVDRTGVPVDADAQVGPVSVGGDWIASSLAAGAGPGPDGFFGDGDDARLSGAGVTDDPGLSSRIAGVTIGGQVLGTAGGADHFGIVAEEVTAVSVGGVALALSAGPHNDDLAVGPTGDVAVRELPEP
jgi:hypothetical protein